MEIRGLGDEWSFCRLLDSDKLITGVAKHKSGQIEANLYSDEFLHFNSSKIKQINLALSDLGVVSILAPFSTGHGSTSSRGKSICSASVVGTNFVYGSLDWDASWRVTEAHFSLKGCDEFFFFNDDVLLQIGTSREVIPVERKFLEASLNSFDLFINYSYEFNNLSQVWNVSGVRVTIGFKKPASLSEVRRVSSDVCLFFSLLSGHLVGASDFSICPNVEDKALVDHFFLWSHQIPFNKRKSSTFYLEVVRSKRDLARLESNILEWLTRSESWGGAYQGLRRFLEQEHDYSPDAAILATRWLEELPFMEQENDMPDGDFSPFKEAVLDALPDEYLAKRDRLASMLEGLKYESRRESLNRHFHFVEATGVQGREKWVSDVMSCFKLRGKFAHSHKSYDSQKEFEKAIDGIMAANALSLAGLYLTLPAPVDEFGVRQGHPMFDYRLRSAFSSPN